MKKLGSFLGLLVLTGYLSACANVRHHGYIAQEKKVAEVKPGETTKKDVKKLMGSPTTYSQVNQNTWYYVGKKKSQIAFLTPDIEDDQIIEVKFDENDVVSSINKKHFNKDSGIEVVSETTPTHGNEMSVMQQLLGNIGRFNAKTRTPE